MLTYVLVMSLSPSHCTPSPHTQEMTEDERQAIEEWGRCDFTQIHEYYKERAELRKQMSKDEKKELKAENEKILEEYGWAIIDGHRYEEVCCVLGTPTFECSFVSHSGRELVILRRSPPVSSGDEGTTPSKDESRSVLCLYCCN